MRRFSADGSAPASEPAGQHGGWQKQHDTTHPEPGKDADVEHLHVREMEEQHRGDSRPASGPPEDRRHDQQIKQHASPGESDPGPRLSHERTIERAVPELPELGTHRFAPQPIGLDLGEAAEDVGDGHLDGWPEELPPRHGPRHEARPPPRVDRPAAMRVADCEPAGQQTDEVEMVVEIRPVHQEGVRVTDGKKHDRQPIAIANGKSHSRQGDGGMDHRGQPAR